MATVFMTWLETTPDDYDRGIQLLTLGRFQRLKERIAADFIQREMQILEIGCGTGTLALLMTQHGARVTAIDVSVGVLAEADRKAVEAGLTESTAFHNLGVTGLNDHFEPGSFDVVVSSLAFSEFPPEVERYALNEAAQLLKPDGRSLIADEMVPAAIWSRLVFWTVRLPLVILTWLLARTTPTPLRNFLQTVSQSGFNPVVSESHLGGSLQLVSARPSVAFEAAQKLWTLFPNSSGSGLRSEPCCLTCGALPTAFRRPTPIRPPGCIGWDTPTANLRYR